MPIINKTGPYGVQIPAIGLTDQTVTPASPAPGTQLLFTKADGLYTVNSDGAVVGPLGSNNGLFTGVQLFRQVLTVAQANFDLTSIPAGYDYIEVTINGKLEGTGGQNDVVLTINGDTTNANYRRGYFYGSESSTGSGGDDTRNIFYMPDSSYANNIGTFTAKFANYDLATLVKSCVVVGVSRQSATATREEMEGLEWENTAAITHINIAPNGVNWAIGTSCVIVGYKTIAGASVGGSSGLSNSGWVSDVARAWTYVSADGPTGVFTILHDENNIISVGMKVKYTQTTVKYGIVTNVATLDGITDTVTIYGGTDYTLANAAISSNFYSSMKAPASFPMDPNKWTVEVTDTTERVNSSPTQNIWYNIGSITINVPIGCWNLGFSANVGTDNSSQNPTARAALSTSNNSLSDANFGTYSQLNTKFFFTTMHSRNMFVTVTSKTTYYFLVSTSSTASGWLGCQNDATPLVIRAVCAYL
jgi:hypothetical protein